MSETPTEVQLDVGYALPGNGLYPDSRVWKLLYAKAIHHSANEGKNEIFRERRLQITYKDLTSRVRTKSVEATNIHSIPHHRSSLHLSINRLRLATTVTRQIPERKLRPVPPQRDMAERHWNPTLASLAAQRSQIFRTQNPNETIQENRPFH